MTLAFCGVKANVILNAVTMAIIYALTFAKTLSTKVNNILFSLRVLRFSLEKDTKWMTLCMKTAITIYS
jgi:hypothetical protein